MVVMGVLMWGSWKGFSVRPDMSYGCGRNEVWWPEYTLQWLWMKKKKKKEENKRKD